MDFNQSLSVNVNNIKMEQQRVMFECRLRQQAIQPRMMFEYHIRQQCMMLEYHLGQLSICQRIMFEYRLRQQTIEHVPHRRRSISLTRKTKR